MPSDDTNLVIISGPVGVGKTSVAEELSGILETAGVAHTCVDLDGLSKTYPRPRHDAFGEQIALKNLSMVWANARALGVRNLIIARVIETREGVQRLEDAVGAGGSLLVQLMASDESLLARVRNRETGSGRDWHEKRALVLASSLSNADVAQVEIDTDERSVAAIANDIRQCLNWT